MMITFGKTLISNSAKFSREWRRLPIDIHIYLYVNSSRKYLILRTRLISENPLKLLRYSQFYIYFFLIRDMLKYITWIYIIRPVQWWIQEYQNLGRGRILGVDFFDAPSHIPYGFF